MARTSDNVTVPAIGVYAQSGAPTFSEDLTELGDSLAQIVAARVATLGDLPATGNWPGRVVFVDEIGPRWWDGASAWMGADVDTGWLTSGLPVAAGTGFSLSGYELRKRSGMVCGVVTLTRTGATITPDSSGNFADLTGVLTMPAGWRYTGTAQDAFLTVQQSGVASFFGRLRRSGVGADGQIDITHGIPSQTLPNGQNVSLTLNYAV